MCYNVEAMQHRPAGANTTCRQVSVRTLTFITPLVLEGEKVFFFYFVFALIFKAHGNWQDLLKNSVTQSLGTGGRASYAAYARRICNLVRAQGPLLHPQWPVGWDPCGEESPCK